ncbi:MAG: sensor domain-containing protein, partial [Acidimicrobiales bacterium]
MGDGPVHFAALAAVGQNSQDLTVVLDADGAVTYANPAALQAFGISLDEGVGTSSFTYLHPDDVSRVVSQFLKLRRRPRSSVSDAVRAVTPAGEVRELEIISTNFIDDPAVHGIVVNGRDVTDQRAAERARAEAELRDVEAQLAAAAVLASSEERFRLAFLDNMAPMIIADLDDRAVAVNDAFCSMVGYTSEELLGRDSALLTYPEDAEVSAESRELILDGSSADARYVKRYLHKSGRVIAVECSRAAARDADGTPLYFVISQRDISDRVQRDHVLRLLSAVNRLAVCALDEMEFGQQLCSVLVDTGGYALAWIGLAVDGGGGGVDVWCAAGETDYLTRDVEGWWGTPDSDAGHAGAAMVTGASQVVHDLAADAPNREWGERARSFGLASSVAIPDRFGTRRAALCVYSRDLGAFDDVAVTGLEEVVREAEFAVAHVRTVRGTERALCEVTAAMEARGAAEFALTESEQRFRLAFEESMAPMVFTDLGDRVIAANDAFCEMVGFAREELTGQDSRQFTYGADVGITEETHRRLLGGDVDQVRYEKRYQRKDGRVIVSEVSRSAARGADGQILYFVSSERDVTDARALTDQLRHQALHDPLTGLANRVLIEDRLAQARARLERRGGVNAVFLLDLDDFKGVNDTHGHFVGDELLAGIARRFELVTRPSDTLCRFGGDEFLYLAEGLRTTDEVDAVASRLLGVLAEPFELHGLRLEQNASLGVVVWNAANADDAELVQQADVALSRAKVEGKGRHVVFTPDMHAEAIERFVLVQELRQAVELGQVEMHFQPIVELATTRVVGFEALMRWHHPERGPIPPDVFIPLAEQNDLIVELGRFALDEAVAAAARWSRADDGEPYVSVNVSTRQLSNPGFAASVEEALAESGLAPHRLVVEITESATLLEARQTLTALEELARLGVDVAIDDFGTGYSSLSYLVRLRPRIIKIDRYFVSPAVEGDLGHALLEAIITLGERLGITMVAEGIETPAQFDRLVDLNCDLGQGFLFSPARPFAEASAMVGRRLG